MSITVDHYSTKSISSARVKEFLASPQQMLVNGEWVDAKSGKTFATYDPASGEVLAKVPQGEAEDIDAAVTAARAAFNEGSWVRMRPNLREDLLWRISQLILERADDFAELESLDNGKPVGIAGAFDVRSAADCFRYYAGWPSKLQGATNNPSMLLAPQEAEFHSYTRREPVGVCAQIIPWNFPLLMAAWKVAPALATGNTVVLKPAEQTPLTALLLGRILVEAGVPAGVVNIVTGFGDAGAALSGHPNVDKVAFTGSTEVGKKIVGAAQGNLKKVSLELGGKSPNIVFADADIPSAVAGTIQGFTLNSGQACEAGTRVYVHKDIYDEFNAALAEQVRALTIGPGNDPDSDITPLVSEEQLERVMGYLDAGKREGARPLVGGNRWGDSGYFVEPTVFVDTTPNMSIVRQEIFGPVAVSIPFSDEEEVIEAANDTEYGLAAALWTRDLSRAHRVAGRLNAGSVWVNTYHALDTALPFGGYHQSGWGRELGPESIDLYTQVKSVTIAL
ncbi:aldehyde dehydrogenase family protein [Paenarthrobacter nitroguajacolicus]|uniref:aldehyde dehydrogenase family protein n=1 Tax=Paenarthrobacter nitroguajacolicus TaxID=211146 RepID=UPI00248AD408|nr:aldehyde dehydrogenase family protein [Paenarthrobacter nitroguajacolicus]MDI2036277.1 Phenylacetaldehyde dehydrogenase [Paenarthrobacter nitroguajacolicus]